MNKGEIKKYLENFEKRKDRTIVIIDYGNVEKWKNSLQWKVDIQKLAILVKSFSYGKQFLRRFYYGEDYGPNDKSTTVIDWSKSVLDRAAMNRFEVVKKRVKYICLNNGVAQYQKKCDLDVEMTVDLIKEKDNYDTMVLFTGDGDLMCAVDYLHKDFNKKCVVLAARGHIGREIMDAKARGFVEDILYADDLEYRLNKARLFGFGRR